MHTDLYTFHSIVLTSKSPFSPKKFALMTLFPQSAVITVVPYCAITTCFVFINTG
ncbi:hypothetical protein D915_007061 [Fasciola hepatica]|uniref:Uncharacterized protein n=1 Tax=Fasciola hepatica TaxID=6192 RepID=A0A4E0R6B7_FASHE|nr:hypothetical protein D915_007061 [Fasciola hepatica]